MVNSGFYPTFVLGQLRAPGEIIDWSRNEIDPSGFRHHASGHYKSAARQNLVGGFTAQMESGHALSFGSPIVVQSGFKTETAVFTFNLGEVNSHIDSYFNEMVAASSVGNFKAFGFRLWKGNLSAFIGPDPELYFRNSAEWRRGYILEKNHSGVLVLPSSFPTYPNIFAKIDDLSYISGAFKEKEFTHFIYMRGFFPSGNYVLGTYGGLGQSDFTINFSYDYTALDANVNYPDDMVDFAIYTPQPLPDSFLNTGVSGHWRLNEKGSSQVRQSEPSGFPNVSMDLTPNTSVGFGSGIVASGHSVSGIAATFNGSNYLESINNNATLNMKYNSPEGPVSFTFAGWFNMDRVDIDQGIFGWWQTIGVDERHQYRLFYQASTKRFTWQAVGQNAVEPAIRYHIFNKLMGDPLANRWYFFTTSYNVTDNTFSIRINDLPIDRRQLADLDKGLRETGTVRFTLGASLTGASTQIMDGLIDSVTLYRNKVLDNRQTILLYNNGSGIDYRFPDKELLNFNGLPPTYANPSAGIKEGLTSSYGLNRPSGSTVWPDDAGVRPLSATFPASPGTIGSTSGIIDSSRVIATSGAVILSRNQPHASGYLQASSNIDARMEPEHDFTIGLWVKLLNKDFDHSICGIWQGSSNLRHWLLKYDKTSDSFIFSMANGTTIGQAQDLISPNLIKPIQVGKWYSIIIVRDVVNSNIRMVVDNQYSTKVNPNFQFNTTLATAPFTVGAHNTDATPTFSDIVLDNLSIWKRKLTDKEIAVYYNNGNGIEWSIM